jgi:hypothetical protein
MSQEIEPSIAFYNFACFCDRQSCKACKEMNGTIWLPDDPNPPSFPYHRCKSREGCRCEPVGHYDDEGSYTFSDANGKVSRVYPPGSAHQIAEDLRKRRDA